MKSDLISLLTSQSAPARGLWQFISLWKQETFHVIFFSLEAVEQMATHFEDEGRFRYQCLGDTCPACRVGITRTEHLYIPVWDVDNRRISILYFHVGADGAGPVLLQFLTLYKDQLADIVARIQCEGRAQIRISAHELPPESDRGAIECAEFCAGFDAGTVTLKDCARQLPVAAIAALPTVKKKSRPSVGNLVRPMSAARVVETATVPLAAVNGLTTSPVVSTPDE